MRRAHPVLIGAALAARLDHPVLIGAALTARLVNTGTRGAELAPSADVVGEDPWSDLWLYANSIFIEIEG